MASLIDCVEQLETRAVLEQHKAGVVTTVFIPTFNIEHFPHYPEILYQTDFKDILDPVRWNDNDSTAMHENDSGDIMFADNHHRYNHKSNNIIDQLEKKYCGGYSMLDPNFDDSSETYHQDSPGPVSEDGNSVCKKKKRKKSQYNQQADYYDMDDSFIDDSDNITEIQSQIAGKYLKTKHSGFFINSGSLEVLEGSDKHIFDKRSKKKQKVQKSSGVSQKKPKTSVKTNEINKESNVSLNPFFLFGRANRSAVKKAHPSSSAEPGGLNKLLGTMWKDLSSAEKDVWLQIAAGAKEIKDKAKDSVMSLHEFYCFINRPRVMMENNCANDEGKIQRLLQTEWSELTGEQIADWERRVEKHNANVKNSSLSLVDAIPGIELFKASKIATENITESRELNRLWDNIASEQTLWEAAAVFVGEDVRRIKASKNFQTEKAAAGGVKMKKKKKKLEKSSQATNDENTCIISALKYVDEGSKKTRSIAATAKAFALAFMSSKSAAITLEKSKNINEPVKKKAIDSSSVGESWVCPPPKLEKALHELKLVVAKDVATQNEIDIAKSKPPKNKPPNEPFLEHTPVSLKRITLNVEEQLLVVDLLAKELSMPGTNPLMKTQKASSTPQAMTEKESTSSDATEPTYLSLLHDIINTPNGSSISTNQIRTNILKLRCRQMINTLKKRIETEIPILAEEIRKKIGLNEKYECGSVADESKENTSEVVESAPNTRSDEEQDNSIVKKPARAPLRFICKWNRELRMHLFQVLDLTAQWVDEENVYRNKYMSAAEKKSLEDHQTEYLSFTSQSTVIYNRIINLAFLPPSDTANCEKSTISFLRKVVSSEKQRFKNS